jgi:hypothetical protein
VIGRASRLRQGTGGGVSGGDHAPV